MGKGGRRQLSTDCRTTPSRRRTSQARHSRISAEGGEGRGGEEEEVWCEGILECYDDRRCCVEQGGRQDVVQVFVGSSA